MNFFFWRTKFQACYKTTYCCEDFVLWELGPSSGAGSNRVWVRHPIMTLVPLSMALNHNCFEEVGKVVYTALPARLLVDDTHTCILAGCEGVNPVFSPRSKWQSAHGCNWLWSIAQISSVHPHLEVAGWPCDVRQSLTETNFKGEGNKNNPNGSKTFVLPKITK